VVCCGDLIAFMEPISTDTPLKRDQLLAASSEESTDILLNGSELGVSATLAFEVVE
jgi:hypothetical protein